MNQAEKARAQLYELQKLPENKVCMDCGARDPRWASLSLGIFICIKCAGAHRMLGTHISTPKSLDQDNWTMEQVETMRKLGNAKAKAYFEATMKPSDTLDNANGKVLSEHIALERFIRRKYEYLDFAPKKDVTHSPSSQPPSNTSSGPTTKSSGPTTKPRATTTSLPSSPVILPSYDGMRKSKDDSLINFDRPSPATDLLSQGPAFNVRDGVNKSDIMQLYDTPKLTPTPAAATPKQQPPQYQQQFPAANYNVSLNTAPNYNPYAPYHSAPPSFPYGGVPPSIPSYINPAFANTVPPPMYGTQYPTPPQYGAVPTPFGYVVPPGAAPYNSGPSAIHSGPSTMHPGPSPLLPTTASPIHSAPGLSKPTTPSSPNPFMFNQSTPSAPVSPPSAKPQARPPTTFSSPTTPSYQPNAYSATIDPTYAASQFNLL